MKRRRPAFDLLLFAEPWRGAESMITGRKPGPFAAAFRNGGRPHLLFAADNTPVSHFGDSFSVSRRSAAASCSIARYSRLSA